MTSLIAAPGTEPGDTFDVFYLPPGEFIIGTVAFLIVFGVLGKLLLPKIRTALAEREELIESGLRAAEDAKEESARMAETNQDELAQAREEAATIRAAAQAERADIIEKARSEAATAAAAVTASAQAQIEQEKNKAGADLQRNVGAIATDLAGRIVGEVLTDDTRAQAVVDRFIGELESAAESTGTA
jgi:F-type H+-transporting ATPase subunit b